MILKKRNFMLNNSIYFISGIQNNSEIYGI